MPEKEFMLKLTGPKVSEKEILDCLSAFISPSNIECLIFDHFYEFFVLYVTNIETMRLLVGKTFSTETGTITILPLLDCFVISGVYGHITNKELANLFQEFGAVFTVEDQLAVPDSSRYGHILGGKRKISFFLPAMMSAITSIGSKVAFPPLIFSATQFCNSCLKEGHSILRCPDIDRAEIPKPRAEVNLQGAFQDKVEQKTIDCDSTAKENEPISSMDTSPPGNSENSDDEIGEFIKAEWDDQDSTERKENSSVPQLPLETSASGKDASTNSTSQAAPNSRSDSNNLSESRSASATPSLSSIPSAAATPVHIATASATAVVIPSVATTVPSVAAAVSTESSTATMTPIVSDSGARSRHKKQCLRKALISFKRTCPERKN